MKRAIVFLFLASSCFGQEPAKWVNPLSTAPVHLDPNRLDKYATRPADTNLSDEAARLEARVKELEWQLQALGRRVAILESKQGSGR